MSREQARKGAGAGERKHRLRRLMSWLSLGLLGWAVTKELRLPKDERTWHGDLAGIPYDLRVATPARLRAAFWNPDDPRVFTPRPMGVGWSVNFARVVGWLKARA